MSEKFTPGPWEVDKENCHAGQIAVCYGDKDTYFEVWSRHWFGGIDQEANAHLISAAPEMYEALVDLFHEADSWCECGKCTACKTDAKVRAALAKARGES